MIQLTPVNWDNIDEILALSVSREQKNFVASNAVSLAEAYAARNSGYPAQPFGISSDGKLVGFVMFGRRNRTSGFPEGRRADILEHVISRFLIDRRYQRQGLGRAALAVCLDYLRRESGGRPARCWLSYTPENSAAKGLYASFGFRETGELCGEELVAVLEL